MDNFPFEEEKKTFGQWMKEHQSGLYLTLIFHLLIMILLTVQGIHGQLAGEGVLVFDFSREEAEQAKIEQEEKEQQQKIEVEREVNEMIRAALNNRETPRNVAVNTADLKDEQTSKSTLGQSRDLHEEAKALQERLDATRRQIEEQQGSDIVTPTNNDKDDKTQKAEVYKGPSVLSYTLNGRKAVSLPIPVYKCQGGGDVTVTIEVNRLGYVTGVAIQKSVSTDDACLHAAAKDAASRSRFNSDPSAPEKQRGEIVYRFIAQ